MNKTLKGKIEAAEMWFFRRMLKISWTDRVSNEEVLRRVNMPRTMLKDIRRRQINFLGHAIRKEKIEHLCLTGKVEGRRPRGRQRIKYLDTIVEDIGGQTTRNNLIQLARDRQRWREVTAHVLDTAFIKVSLVHQ